MILDLPKANYTIWVRGYGLRIPCCTECPWQALVNLTATPALTVAAAGNTTPACTGTDARDTGKDRSPAPVAGNGIRTS